ncbi:MAG TPA: hypothetical protein VEY30_09440, partial [Myxococcaceae bacterium]|nr:hypothetical protein [Myxococcaceae bacterium]
MRPFFTAGRAAFLSGVLLGCGGEISTPQALAHRGPDASAQNPDPTVNAPPRIGELTAARLRGSIPFEAEVRWTVSDPEGQALRCELILEGSPEAVQRFDPCSAQATSLTIAAEGEQTLRLVAVDAAGARAERTLTLTGRRAVGDLVLGEVTWGQSVMAPAPRLVAGKGALLRAFVLGSVDGLSAARVNLTATAQGQSLGTVELNGPAALPTAVSEGALDQSFRADVPADWVRSGLQLTLEVDPDDAVAETEEGNNRRVLTPAIGEGTVLPLTVVPVVYGGVTGSTPANVASGVLQLWPLRDVEVRTRAPYTYTGRLSADDSSTWGTLLQELQTLRATDGSTRYYYGFVRVTYGSGIAGIGYLGAPVATGRDDSVP